MSPLDFIGWALLILVVGVAFAVVGAAVLIAIRRVARAKGDEDRFSAASRDR